MTCSVSCNTHRALPSDDIAEPQHSVILTPVEPVRRYLVSGRPDDTPQNVVVGHSRRRLDRVPVPYAICH